MKPVAKVSEPIKRIGIRGAYPFFKRLLAAAEASEVQLPLILYSGPEESKRTTEFPLS